MLKRTWNWLIGDSNNFSVESRIFHSFSIIAIIAASIQAISGINLHLYLAGIISFIFVIVQVGLHYLSRFKNKLKLAITLSAAMANLICAAVYLYNSGVTGSMLFIFPTVTLFIILATSNKQSWFWVIVNLVIVMGLLCAEYFYPQIILKHYDSRAGMFIDMVLTYLVVICLIYLCTTIMRRGYQEQKALIKEKADKLELINQEKDRLFSVIGHDLNTPLASVKQYIELLEVIDMGHEDRKNVERRLITALDDAQYLLGNLLLWANSQRQHKPIQLLSTELEPTLKQTISMFEKQAYHKGIKTEVSMGIHGPVISDQNMLQAVMRNLLNNAVKFTPNGGKISVSSSINKDSCIIEVKDNGIGIDLEKQARIFTPEMVSTYGTANEKGTGLGLLLCKEFMENQGGKIWLKSKPGVGTTFYLVLPIIK